MFKTRREPENPYLNEARRRIGKMAPDAAREYSISIWVYGMRVAENPTEYLSDDLGEWDGPRYSSGRQDRMAGLW